MKKNLYFFLILMIAFTGTIFAQDVRDDNTIPVEDNSQYAKDWAEVVNARETQDEAIYLKLLSEFNAKYSDRTFKSIPYNQTPGIVVQNKTWENNTPDWGIGDVRVHSGQTMGGLDGIRKNQILRADTVGNVYLAVNNNLGDTLFIYKSSNKGANWTPLWTIKWNPGFILNSFDFYVADSTNNTFKLGFALSFGSSPFTDNCNMWFMKVMADGSGIPVYTLVLNKPAGISYRSPSIVSDAFVYSPASTYWYIAFQRVDSSSGNTNASLVALSTNWGQSWSIDTIRNLDDSHLTIDYEHLGPDTIYVALKYNDTPAVIRLMKIALTQLATSSGWTQLNVTTSGTVTDPHMAVDRQDGEIIVTYTLTNGSKTDIVAKSKTPTVPLPPTETTLVSQTNSVSFSRIDNEQRQGAFRMAYKSGDTIKYKSGFNLSGLAANTPTTASSNTATGVLYPSIAGIRSGAAFDAVLSFAGFGPRNIWVDGSAISPVGITPISQIANNYELNQNYPNPFNPVTSIKFSIPASEQVSLKIYDLTGKEVASLVNSRLNSGVYEYKFDASKLSSGVYFYKLSAGNFSDIKKMMLVK